MSSFINDKKKLWNETTLIKNSEDLFSNDIVKISNAVSFFRVLCDDEEPPTKIMIERSIVPRVIELSKSRESPIASDACYILCLLAGGDKKDLMDLLDRNLLNELILIFPSNDSELESLILWSCDQFAQTFKGSKTLYDSKFIEKLRDRYQCVEFSRISSPILHRLSSLLLTLAMYHSSPFGFLEPIDFDLYEPAIVILKKFLLEVHEKSVLQTLMKIFSEFTRISDVYIDILFLKIPIFLTKALELMIKFPHDLILTQTCLQIFINIASGYEYHGEIIIQNSLILNSIHLMMNHADLVTKRLACQVIACLSTGPSSHKEILIHHANNILLTLLLILETEYPMIHEKEESFLIVKECSDTLSYLIIGGNHDQVQTILLAHPILLNLLLDIAKFNYTFLLSLDGNILSEKDQERKERSEGLFMFSLESLEYLFKNFLPAVDNEGSDDHPEEDEDDQRREEKRKTKDLIFLEELKKKFMSLNGDDFLCEALQVPASHPEIQEQIAMLLQVFFPDILK